MKQFKNLRLFIAMSWKISPSYILLLIFGNLLSSGQIFANVVLPKFLIDELVGGRAPERIALFVLLIVASNVLFALIGKTQKRTMDIKNILMQERMNLAMAEKIQNVAFSNLENPGSLDLKERAVFAVTNQSAMSNLINSSASVVKNAFTIAGLLAVMFTLGWLLVVILTATIGATLLLYALFAKYQTAFFKNIIPTNRKYGYYVGLCYNDRLQKDIRLFGMSKMMTDRVTKYNREINVWFSAFYKRLGGFLALCGIINDLQTALAYGYVSYRVLNAVFGRRIGIGSFTMYVAAAINFATATVELGRNITTFMQMLSYLDPFAEFMRIPDETGQTGTLPFPRELECIRFENVSFKYPGSDAYVLNNVSLDIKKGEKVSIVGLNGAGKTTLIKLLCRLYRPTAGRITINGTDISEYGRESYINAISAVFQDFKLFDFSIGENITCGEPGEARSETEHLLETVGMSEKIKKLPSGVTTLIGKAYSEEGTELSGGESQKIAIARALFKNAPLIILDEPTSALDPLAEADIYENFNRLIGDKTAIYISHRMSSSVFCDKIAIIDGGTVSDIDTHRNLMKKTQSLYYKLFTSQAQNYSE